jgi:LacI family repressor for deo operon, udp, cdd, tsx, nupC, and nupG
VVGFDNIFGSELCTPAITTLAERTEDAGARAVELLGQQAYQRVAEPRSVLLPTHLVVRGSTGQADGKPL